MIQFIALREVLKRIDRRVLIITLVLVLLSGMLIIQNLFFSVSPFAGQPSVSVTSPSALDLTFYYSRSGNTYTHYIVITVEFNDPDGNISQTTASYSFTSGGTQSVLFTKDFAERGIYGHSYTKAVIRTEEAPASVPQFFYLYVSASMTLMDGTVKSQSFENPYKLSYDTQLEDADKQDAEDLAVNAISVVNKSPPTGLSAIVSWEVFMIIPVVLTVLSVRRKKNEPTN